MHSTTVAGPATPSDLIARFGTLVHSRELEALVALYEPQAVFVPSPGIVHRGADAIRSALGQMLALSPTMHATVSEVHACGELALVIVDWTLEGTAPDGSAVRQSGRSADVLRQQDDGTWRVVIDHP